MIIVSNIKAVDKAILSGDEDCFVCATLQMIAEKYGSKFEQAFANGGDQDNNTISEKPTLAEFGIALIDGFGN